jgi:tRNA(fMet)-specific endonuclease VapC
VRVALDTNGYVGFCQGEEKTVDLLEKADSIYLPFVVLAELRAGFAVGKRGTENESVLGLFLSKPEVHSRMSARGLCGNG